jgi:hypothetical protein
MAKKSVRVPMWIDSSKVVVFPIKDFKEGNELTWFLPKVMKELKFDQLVHENGNFYIINMEGFDRNEKRRILRKCNAILSEQT